MFKKLKANKQDPNLSSKGLKTLLLRILIYVGVPVIISYLVVSVVLMNIVSTTVSRLTTNEFALSRKRWPMILMLILENILT